MQELANRNNTIVCLYSTAGHGKVDHTGGMAKVKVRRELAAGKKLQFTNQMVEFLSGNFNNKPDPAYFQTITMA